MLLWIGRGGEVRCGRGVINVSHIILIGVVVSVTIIKGGECYTIVGLDNPHVVLFILLVVCQDIECISPGPQEMVDSLGEVVFVGFQESSITCAVSSHEESQSKVPFMGFGLHLL